MCRDAAAPPGARMPRITCAALLVPHHTVFHRVLNILPRRQPRYNLRKPLRPSALRQRVHMRSAGYRTHVPKRYTGSARQTSHEVRLGSVDRLAEFDDDARRVRAGCGLRKVRHARRKAEAGAQDQQDETERHA